MCDKNGINKQEFLKYLEDLAVHVETLADCVHGDQIMVPDVKAELQNVESILNSAKDCIYQLIEKY